MWKFSLFFVSIPIQSIILLSIPDNRIGTYVFIADILFICVFVLCAFFHFYSIKVYVTNTNIFVTQGVFIKSSHTTNLLQTDSINTTRGPLQKLMGIYKVTLVYASDEVVLYLSSKNLSKLLSKTKAPTEKNILYKSTFLSSLVMSAVFQNSLGSLLTLTPLLRNIGSVVNSETNLDFFVSTDILSLLLPRISPLLSALATFLFCLWILGLCVTFSRYFPLKIFVCNKTLTIKHGLLIKHLHKVKANDIRSIVLRRGFLLLILGKYCAELRFSSEKGEDRLPVICTDNPPLHLRSAFFFGANGTKNTAFRLRPHPLSMWGYLWLPISLLSLFFLCIITTDILTAHAPQPHLYVFIILWLCLWFFLRFLAFCHSTVFCEENILTIRSFSLLSLTDAIIPFDKIRAVKITRTIFQKHRGTCTLRVYIKSRKKKSFFIKHTDYKKTAELIKKLCGNNQN